MFYKIHYNHRDIPKAFRSRNGNNVFLLIEGSEETCHRKKCYWHRVLNVIKNFVLVSQGDRLGNSIASGGDGIHSLMFSFIPWVITISAPGTDNRMAGQVRGALPL